MPKQAVQLIETTKESEIVQLLQHMPLDHLQKVLSALIRLIKSEGEQAAIIEQSQYENEIAIPDVLSNEGVPFV